MSAAEKLEYETADLISVESAPAQISVNYEEVRTQLEQQLEKYDLVVTADTLAGAKKLATELNKMASEFDKRRKAAVEQVSGPIRLFEDQMKGLTQLCKDGRLKITDQVKRFEDETREQARIKLEQRRSQEWGRNGVSEEFRKAQIDDLVKITALTKTGSLTAATLHDLSLRINADKQLQQQTEMRLLHLENQSYKAGLAAPLTRAHVETFLFADDDAYENQLYAVLQAELRREEIAQERMRQRMEAEQQRKQAEADAQARREQEARERGERMQQAEAARAELQQQHKPNPQPEPEPEPEPLPEAAIQKYAFGLLSSPRTAKIVECEPYQIEQAAIETSSEHQEPIGIWVPGNLIAIVYGGEVFRKA